MAERTINPHSSLRVLHGPYNVGNQPWVLSRQERRLGIRSDLVVTSSTWLGYRADRCLVPARRNPLGTLVGLLSFTAGALFRYDVLHYYFGESYLNFRRPRWPSLAFLDLKLARRLGRTIFMTLQGCDVRLSDHAAQRNPTSMCRPGHCPSAADCRSHLDARRRWLIREILPLCDRVFVLNPDLCQDIPAATFLPYASVDVEALQPVPPKTKGPIVVVHAPSNEGIKGSRYIRAALESLARRWPLEVRMVHGVPHHQALKIYAEADFIIDQVLAGWYGGFAVEAMALGKPVGCHLHDPYLAYLPAGMRAELPLVRLDPRHLEQDLETAFRRRAEWPDWGQRGRAYVLRWHHPARIARAMVHAYQNPDAPFCLEPDSLVRAA